MKSPFVEKIALSSYLRVGFARESYLVNEPEIYYNNKLTVMYPFFFTGQQLMNQPVSMACGHSTCMACLQEMICYSAHGKTSPLYREKITPGKLNINIAVRALISRIRVRCTQVGHEWVGEHCSINDHSVNCPFMLVQRANGCIVSHSRNRIDKI